MHMEFCARILKGLRWRARLPWRSTSEAQGLFYFGVSYEPRAFFFYDLDRNTDAGLGWDPRRDETSTHWQLKWIYPLPASKFTA